MMKKLVVINNMIISIRFYLNIRYYEQVTKILCQPSVSILEKKINVDLDSYLYSEP